MVIIKLPIGATKETIGRLAYHQLIQAGLVDVVSQASAAMRDAHDAAGVLLELVKTNETIQVEWI